MTEINGNIQQNQGFNPYHFSENMHEIGPQMPEITYPQAVERIESYQDESFRELQMWIGRFRALNTLLIGLPVIVFSWFAIIEENLTAAGVITVVLYGLSYLAYRRAKRFLAGQEYKSFSNIKENIYVYSQRPGDTTVNRRKREFEEKLNASKNQSGAKVVAVKFADHLNANEQWTEEWPTRLLNTVLADRAIRHKVLGEKDPEWYDTYILKQE